MMLKQSYEARCFLEEGEEFAYVKERELGQMKLDLGQAEIEERVEP